MYCMYCRNLKRLWRGGQNFLGWSKRGKEQRGRLWIIFDGGLFSLERLLMQPIMLPIWFEIWARQIWRKIFQCEIEAYEFRGDKFCACGLRCIEPNWEQNMDAQPPGGWWQNKVLIKRANFPHLPHPRHYSTQRQTPKTGNGSCWLTERRMLPIPLSPCFANAMRSIIMTTHYDIYIKTTYGYVLCKYCIMLSGFSSTHVEDRGKLSRIPYQGGGHLFVGGGGAEFFLGLKGGTSFFFHWTKGTRPEKIGDQPSKTDAPYR